MFSGQTFVQRFVMLQ